MPIRDDRTRLAPAERRFPEISDFFGLRGDQAIPQAVDLRRVLLTYELNASRPVVQQRGLRMNLDSTGLTQDVWDLGIEATLGVASAGHNGGAIREFRAASDLSATASVDVQLYTRHASAGSTAGHHPVIKRVAPGDSFHWRGLILCAPGSSPEIEALIVGAGFATVNLSVLYELPPEGAPFRL